MKPILGLCFIISGIFLRIRDNAQTGDTQRIYSNAGLFAVIIGLNIMIVVFIIWYYNKNPRE
jgi:hypothetical protein